MRYNTYHLCYVMITNQLHNYHDANYNRNCNIRCQTNYLLYIVTATVTVTPVTELWWASGFNPSPPPPSKKKSGGPLSYHFSGHLASIPRMLNMHLALQTL